MMAYIPGAEYINGDFSGQNISGNVYYECYFERCNFNNADLRNVKFDDTDLKYCTFIGADLRNSIITNGNGIECVFDNADMRDSSGWLHGISYKNAKINPDEIDNYPI